MKAINQKLKFSGVYAITNLVNGKHYIGSSKNIYRRLLTHRSYLRHNIHCNSHLQNAWNLYGEDNFDYFILEKCEEENRTVREKYYIDILHPEYNIVLEDITLPSYSEESRRKHSETKKKMYAEKLLLPNNSKTIYAYDLQGNFVKSYYSIAEASRDLNIYYGLIRKVLKGTQQQCHGYRFYFSPQENLGVYVKTKDVTNQYKPIIVYNDEETYTFKNADECAEFFNMHPTSIRNSILHNRCFRRKYKISYIKGRATK